MKMTSSLAEPTLRTMGTMLRSLRIKMSACKKETGVLNGWANSRHLSQPILCTRGIKLILREKNVSM